MGGEHRLDALPQEVLHLLRTAADIARRLQMGGELLPAQAEERVGGNEVNEVVGFAPVLYIAPGLQGVDPDALVKLLTVAAPLHRWP